MGKVVYGDGKGGEVEAGQTNDWLLFDKGNEQRAYLNAALIGGGTDVTSREVYFCAGWFGSASEPASVGHDSSSIVLAGSRMPPELIKWQI